MTLYVRTFRFITHTVIKLIAELDMVIIVIFIGFNKIRDFLSIFVIFDIYLSNLLTNLTLQNKN